MQFRCPTCGNKALSIPWRFLVEDSIDTRCAACDRAFSSTLVGPLNTARRYLMTLFAIVLGMSLFPFIGWLRLWVVALFAVLSVDAGWKLYLHSRSIQHGVKANDRVPQPTPPRVSKVD